MNVNTFKQEYFKNRKWKCAPKKIVNSVVSEVVSVACEILPSHKSLTVLDIGCGQGEYSIEFSKYARKVVGVEPDFDSYKEAVKFRRKTKSKVTFINCPVEKYKTKSSFDIVLSLTTVEHMSHVEKSLKRIFELLKPGGFIYLTVPNKWWPYEHHYRLYFLSWLPLKLANFYVKTYGHRSSYEDSAYSKSYFGMKSLFDKFDCTYEFVLPRDLNSSYIGCGEQSFFYIQLSRSLD